VSLSDGLVSALRGPDGKDPIIQTTAPISQGSSGGGLFNEDGKLVGITTLQARSGQNLNFAIPAEWITELGERMKAAEEKKQTQLATLRNAAGASYNPAAPGLPVPGMTWKYRYTDRTFSRQQVFTVRVTGVDGWVVQETLVPEGGGSSLIQRTSVGAEDLRFFTRGLPPSQTLVEFAPYLGVVGERLPESPRIPAPSGYPKDRNSADWDVAATVTRGVALRYATTELASVRIELRGVRPLSGASQLVMPDISRFEVKAWYATETRRLVRLENRAWYSNGQLAADDVVELLEYSGG
jgi:serine protease Do